MAREDGGFDVVCPQPGADRMVVPENWTFESKEVADHFDEHVREQLPWYDLATQGGSSRGPALHAARRYGL